ncbi:MAG: hypothetical protein ABIO86_10455 [Sphingomonas sp.]
MTFAPVKGLLPLDGRERAIARLSKDWFDQIESTATPDLFRGPWFRARNG